MNEGRKERENLPFRCSMLALEIHWDLRAVEELMGSKDFWSEEARKLQSRG